MQLSVRNALLALSALMMLALVSAPSRADEPDPAPDKRQYIRRLTLDLTGVPPTPQEVQTFVEDRSPDCYKNLIKRLGVARDELAIERVDKNTLDKWVTTRPELVVLDTARLNGIYGVALRKQISASYLGVGVESPTATIRSQLRLPEGAGLVVNYVDADGPAKGLIREHDVLQKLDEQVLVNGEQLVTLVRMHKSGETVALTLIREAKPVVVPIKLGEKQIDAVGNAGDANTTYSGGLIQGGNYLAADPNINWADPALAAIHGGLANANTARALFYPTKDLIVNANELNQPALVARQTGPLTFDDGKTLVLYYLSPAGKPQTITVLDRASGKVLYSGPTGNDEAWNAVPEEVRQKLASWRDMLRQVNGTPGPATRPSEKR